MAEGVVTAWKQLEPAIPVFFTIHGTGEDDAVALVHRELGFDPYDRMDSVMAAAVRPAVAAASCSLGTVTRFLSRSSTASRTLSLPVRSRPAVSRSQAASIAPTR